MKKTFLAVLLLGSLSFAEEFYCIQVASSKDLKGIKDLFRKVNDFPDPRVEKIGDYFVLRVGFFSMSSTAGKYLERLRLIRNDAFLRKCLLVPERIVLPRRKERTRVFTYSVGMKLATFYLKKKDLKSAEKIYRELSELYPDSREVRLQLARVLYWQGKYDEAIAIYRYLEKFDPEVANERRQVEVKKALKEAEVLEKEGRIEEAIDILERLYREERDYQRGLKLSHLYVRAGMYEKAKSLLEDLMRSYPENPQLKNLYSKLGKAGRDKKKLTSPVT